MRTAGSLLPAALWRWARCLQDSTWSPPKAEGRPSADRQRAATAIPADIRPSSPAPPTPRARSPHAAHPSRPHLAAAAPAPGGTDWAESRAREMGSVLKQQYPSNVRGPGWGCGWRGGGERGRAEASGGRVSGAGCLLPYSAASRLLPQFALIAFRSPFFLFSCFLPQ